MTVIQQAKENLKNSKMKVVDYFGPKVAQVKLSEHDSETLYKYCLEAQEPYNSKLLGNVREQNSLTEYLQNTNLCKTISNYMEDYLNFVDAGYWKTAVESKQIPNFLEMTDAWYNKQVHMENTVLHDHRHSADLVCVIFPKIYLDEDAEYFKTHQIPNQKGQLFFIYADSIKNDFGKSSIEVQPEEGDMFIFPSQLSHYTAPVLGKSYRYSISCNFNFTTKAKNLLHKMSKNEN